MISLSAIAKQEKNKLSTDSSFVILLDINLGDDIIRICYNTDNVIWKGNTYIPFPFTIGDVSEDSDGSDPAVNLQVDNTSQALQYLVEQNGGGNNTEVILRVVNTLALDGDAELEETFVVTKTSVNQQYVTFTLGTEYSSRTRRPLNRYMKNNCPFRYKSIRCGCTSELTSCAHTLTDCRARGNSARFGGFQGIDQNGVYVR